LICIFVCCILFLQDTQLSGLADKGNKKMTVIYKNQNFTVVTEHPLPEKIMANPDLPIFLCIAMHVNNICGLIPNQKIEITLDNNNNILFVD
jgi:hypothetical protein